MRDPFEGHRRRSGIPDEIPVLDMLRERAPLFLKIGAFVLVLIVIARGTYSVGPGEQGVIRTFGRESGKTGPGLHYRVPFVQDVDVVNLEQIRRLEIGAPTDKGQPSEAHMLTGDANIVDVQLIVQYRVTDSSRFLFRMRAPEAALRSASEVALRSLVGTTDIDGVITTGRERVQDETRVFLQRLMDDYESGITVTEVKLLAVDAPTEVRDAFHEVVRAREEKEKVINQALGYQADLIPRARGEARKIEREAEGYKEERILRAKGDGARFTATLAEYRRAERVTRDRLHLEAMERIVGRLEGKVIVDGELSKSVLPLLNLGQAAKGEKRP